MTPIITTLAEYQTHFWIEVGLELRRQGHAPVFLSFDSRSNEILEQAGLDYVDATANRSNAELGNRDPAEVCRQYGIANLNHWLTHEKFAFGVRNSEALLRKLAGSLLLADQAIRKASAGSSPIMVQELGGFLSVIGAHFAALNAGLPSWFIEPSFFRGRMLFLEGDVAARAFPAEMDLEPSGEVEAYLSQTLATSAIVIPEKDRHQYTTAFRKVVNWRNFKRLAEKIVDKHVLGKEQEFGHIGSHVSAHARMILASRKLAGHYSTIDSVGRFVYYPLHVPGDMALTLRSPEYLDQIALIDYICRVAPHDVTIAVKEHPAMIGAIGAEPLLRLKRRYDRLAIIPPSTNNYDVLSRAEAVITVNSKSGAEAGLLGKPVIVLGDAFYRNAPFAHPVRALAELGPAIETVLTSNGTHASPERYFAALWPATYPGELYVTNPDNIQSFTTSFLAATGNS